MRERKWLWCTWGKHKNELAYLKSIVIGTVRGLIHSSRVFRSCETFNFVYVLIMTANGYLCCITLLLCYLTSPIASTDQAYIEGVTGTDIVLRCVDLITYSGIFPYDEEMVRRIAYVETRDGATLTSGYGGIWQVLPTVFDDMKSETWDVTTFYWRIQQHFNIDWEEVNYVDLDIPIYSALAVRMALAYFERTSGSLLSSSITFQYNVWNFFLKGDSSIIGHNEFEELVSNLPSASLCPSIYRDIILLVDRSAESIPDPNIEFVKSFLNDVVDYFNISSTRTRIGVIQYAVNSQVKLLISKRGEIIIVGTVNRLKILLGLNEGISLSAVQSAITNMQAVSSSLVYTGLNLGQAISQFDPSVGGRDADSAVARLIVLVAHSPSSDNIATQVEFANSNGIGIIVIGIGSNVSEAHLDEIVGSRNENKFQVSLYSDLNGIVLSAQQKICQEQVLVAGDKTISGNLEPGEIATFAISTPPEGKNLTVSTSQGTVSNFFSTTLPTPSAVAHDYRMNVDIPNIQVYWKYVPAAGETTLYSTVQAKSSVTARFLYVIGDPNDTTTTITPPVVASATQPSLSDGEIAGIVFACLIVVCGILVALIYYWFCRINPFGSAKSIERHKLEPLASYDMRKDSIEIKRSIFENHIEPELVLPVPPEEPPLTIPEKSPPLSPTNTEKSEETLSNFSDDKDSITTVTEYDPETEIRLQLKEAIEENDLEEVAVAVRDFKNMQLVDIDGDLIRGERLLGMNECLQGLNYAISKRDVKTLERAIFATKQNNYQEELKIDLKKSEALLKDLKKIEQLMARLLAALNANDMKLAEILVFEIRALSGYDEATVDRMINVYRCKEDLRLAMANRDKATAVKVLKKIKDNGFDSDLPSEIRQADKMINELEYLEKVQNDVLNLSQARVAEIRSYSYPPAGTHEVMKALYLLLGFPDSDLQNWSNIQTLMAKTGKDSLKHLIKKIDPRNMKQSQIEAARVELAPFSVDQVKDISIGLALFYVLAFSVIDEVEKLNSGVLGAPSPFFFELTASRNR